MHNHVLLMEQVVEDVLKNRICEVLVCVKLYSSPENQTAIAEQYYQH